MTPKAEDVKEGMSITETERVKRCPVISGLMGVRCELDVDHEGRHRIDEKDYIIRWMPRTPEEPAND